MGFLFFFFSKHLGLDFLLVYDAVSGGLSAHGFLKLGLVVVLAERLTAMRGLCGSFAADRCCC